MKRSFTEKQFNTLSNLLTDAMIVSDRISFDSFSITNDIWEITIGSEKFMKSTGLVSETFNKIISIRYKNKNDIDIIYIGKFENGENTEFWNHAVIDDETIEEISEILMPWKN